MLKDFLKDLFGVAIGTFIWSLIIGIVIGGIFIWSLAYFFPCAIGTIFPNIACVCP